MQNMPRAIGDFNVAVAMGFEQDSLHIAQSTDI